ncbi:hypothetical protein [Megasphaera cerevisiae]|nr:hypothetical protein [Megasphaera cerevisiae]
MRKCHEEKYIKKRAYEMVCRSIGAVLLWMTLPVVAAESPVGGGGQ